jgi:hypothetical protein
MPFTRPVTGIRAFDAAKHPRDVRGRFAFAGGRKPAPRVGFGRSRTAIPKDEAGIKSEIASIQSRSAEIRAELAKPETTPERKRELQAEAKKISSRASRVYAKAKSVGVAVERPPRQLPPRDAKGRFTTIEKLKMDLEASRASLANGAKPDLVRADAESIQKKAQELTGEIVSGSSTSGKKISALEERRNQLRAEVDALKAKAEFSGTNQRELAKNASSLARSETKIGKLESQINDARAKLRDKLLDKSKVSTQVQQEAERIKQAAIVVQQDAIAGKASSFGNVQFVGVTGEEFKKQVADSLDRVPSHIHEAVNNAGVKVVAAELVTSHRPELKGMKPRGWSSGTWDSAEGLYNKGQKEVLVTEKFKRRSNGPAENSKRIPGVVLHEYGHAVDANFSPGTVLSSDQRFVDAYKQDVSQIDPSAKPALSYFLQRGDAGREEAFAEIFAQIHGYGSTMSRLLPQFPRTRLAMQELLKGPTQ